MYSRALFSAIAGIARANSLEELLFASDCVSLHCALSDETRHIICEKTIAQMRQGSPLAILALHSILFCSVRIAPNSLGFAGAFIVNTAHGALIDELALAGALRAGKIKGAALDVFESEPFTLANSTHYDFEYTCTVL